MANVDVFQEVVSVDDSEVEVLFTSVPHSYDTDPNQLIYISVDDANSGTIQFSVAQAITPNFKAWPAGSQIPVTIRNGVRNLRYKASAAGQKFTVTM